MVWQALCLGTLDESATLTSASASLDNRAGIRIMRGDLGWDISDRPRLRRWLAPDAVAVIALMAGTFVFVLSRW